MQGPLTPLQVVAELSDRGTRASGRAALEAHTPRRGTLADRDPNRRVALNLDFGGVSRGGLVGAPARDFVYGGVNVHDCLRPEPSLFAPSRRRGTGRPGDQRTS